MNTKSHLFLGALVRKKIEEHTGFSLGRFSFLYGNIRPDLSPSAYTVQHNMENHFALIEEEIKSLYREKDMPLRKLSYRIGVICHYLTDFFCHAHLPEQNCHGLRHIKYESLLSYRHGWRAKATKNLDFSVPPVVLGSPKSLCAAIEELYEKYRALPPSFRNDLAFAFLATAMVVASIISFVFGDLSSRPLPPEGFAV